MTYYRGSEDAARVTDEIRTFGAKCDTLQCDVADPDFPPLAAGDYTPSHIFYFASPPIFVRSEHGYDPRVFRRFSEVYVDGVYRTYRAVRTHWSDQLTLFYPSSVAVGEPSSGLAEYAAAKAAGEVLCRQLEADDGVGARVHRPAPGLLHGREHLEPEDDRLEPLLLTPVERSKAHLLDDVLVSILSQLLFLVLVAVGLPVLAGGRGGFGIFMGPTADFLLAWPLVALVIGLLFERFWQHLNPVTATAILVFGGIIVLYPIGIAWVAAVAGVPLSRAAMAAGAFIPGDIAKAVATAAVALTVKRSYPLIRAA